MKRPPVSIIIPAWNAWGATQSCLDSLRPTLGVRDEVIVVDNGSQDDTARELTKYPWVKVLHHDENLGFAKGNNTGAELATNEILVFLNNDTLTPPRWLDELLVPFDDPEVGATGPMSNYVSGLQYVPNAPYEQTNSISEFKKFARNWQAENAGEFAEVDRLVGFCIAIRRVAFDQVGYWDERYGLGGFEDDDMCKGLAQHNWKLIMCKGSFVHHTGHVTFSTNNLDVMGIQADNGEKFASKFGQTAFVSACLIMKDEEENVLQCIDSLRKFADEIVIYDTGSTDNSITLARQAGARVIEGFWDDDFSRARNAALEECNGEWAIHLDLDEVLQVLDKKTAINYLKDPNTPDALLVPITNHGDAVTGGRIGHQRVCLFRRDVHKWRGRLHEQVIYRDSDKQIIAATFPYLRIDHYGYTKEALEGKNKVERNIRMAEADIATSEGDSAYKRMNLARSYSMAGRYEDALDELILAEADGIKNKSSDATMRAIFRSAADYALGVGRPQEAFDWANKLETVSKDNTMARYLRGQALINMGEPEKAVKEFEGLSEVADDDGLTYSEEDVTARRGLALLAQKKWPEARRELEKAGKMGTAAAIWFPLVQAVQESGGNVADIAELLPEGQLNNALCQLFLAEPEVADEIIEAYLKKHPDNVSVLAFSIRLAPTLSHERALTWSDRLRGVGLAEYCPLITQAKTESRPVRFRIIAAALAVACFEDKRGLEIVGQLGARVDESDFVNVIVQLNELAPAALRDFIVGAANTPKRSIALARVLSELGAPEEALAIAEFGLTQPGADRILTDEIQEWLARLRATAGTPS